MAATAILTAVNLNITAGVTVDYSAVCSAGNSFINNGRTFLHFKNTSASTVVSISSQVTCSQGVAHHPTITVASASGDIMVGPFPTSRFNDVNGYVQMTYTAFVGVTVAVINVE